MDKFLEYIEKYKFAILGTVLFHVIFFMTANFATVKNPVHHLEEEITEVAIETDAIEMDEEMLKMLNEQNEMLNAEEVYNLAKDENDSRERSYENYSSQQLDEQVENEARELEQQYFEEWAARHKDDSPSSSQERGEDDNTSESDRNNEKKGNNQLDDDGENAFAGKVMVSFNLKDRNAHALEIPGYTCNGTGTVVISIRVDQNGDVRSASYNSNLSSGATECMIEKAERYAKRARFNYNASAGTANGTITYRFIGQ